MLRILLTIYLSCHINALASKRNYSRTLKALEGPQLRLVVFGINPEIYTLKIPSNLVDFISDKWDSEWSCVGGYQLAYIASGASQEEVQD